jgi:hypothetical protein
MSEVAQIGESTITDAADEVEDTAKKIVDKIGQNPVWNTLRDLAKIITNLAIQIYESDFDVGVKVGAFITLLMVLFMIISPFLLVITSSAKLIAFLLKYIIVPIKTLLYMIVGLVYRKKNCKVVCGK